MASAVDLKVLSGPFVITDPGLRDHYWWVSKTSPFRVYGIGATSYVRGAM